MPANRRVSGAATDVAELQQRLGSMIDPSLLERAVTHRSYAYEQGGLPHNERLEFLGDAVLGLVVTDELYRRHPDAAEGHLARLRAAVVNARSLAAVASTIGLGEFLRLGVGEERTHGREKSSILADTVEAVIGAVYIDAGMTAATALVHTLVDPLIARAEVLGAGLDWKTSLQELAARLAIGAPVYRLTETGPDHAKNFAAEVVFDGVVHGRGDGPSKKVAEGAAAQAAWQALGGEQEAARDGAAGPATPDQDVPAPRSRS